MSSKLLPDNVPPILFASLARPSPPPGKPVAIASCNMRTPNEQTIADAQSAASFRSHQQGLPPQSRQTLSPLAASKKPLVETRTDAQTGLPNRTAFREEIHRRLSEAQRHGNRVSIMLVKIDNLASLTKMRSPSDADLILRSCAQFFTAALRDMDLIVRYEAEEFGVMLPGTSLANAAGVGHRLRTTIQQCPLRLREDEIHFTLSAGVAGAQPGEDLNTLLNRTAEAKNTAARAENSVRFHNGLAIEEFAGVQPAPQQQPATAANS